MISSGPGSSLQDRSSLITPGFLRKIDHPGEAEKKLDRPGDGQGQLKYTLTVNEFGLYSLIFENKTAFQ